MSYEGDVLAEPVSPITLRTYEKEEDNIYHEVTTYVQNDQLNIGRRVLVVIGRLWP